MGQRGMGVGEGHQPLQGVFAVREFLHQAGHAFGQGFGMLFSASAELCGYPAVGSQRFFEFTIDFRQAAVA